MSKNYPRIIALYLPQYHPFPENDEWWGKGFTEWTSTARAVPLYKGHYQPHIPADLGFYDLRLREVREQQAELAGEAGIEGFCYWHYWFGNGKQLMAEIINDVIASGKPDFPFMLGWANHSWYAKNWNSKDSKKDRLLIEQTFPGEEDIRMHYEYARIAFKDPRYIKEGNRPLFMVYIAKAVPERMIELWNQWAKEDGFDGIYFLGNVPYDADESSFIEKGFSSVIKDRPNKVKTSHHEDKLMFIIKKFKSRIFGIPDHLTPYKKAIDMLVDEEDDSKETIIPNLVPNFDHSPRSGRYGLILDGSTPDLFYGMCTRVLNIVKKKQNKFIMLRSWNEWGEGNHMEPDLKFGKGYIKALRRAIDNE